MPDSQVLAEALLQQSPACHWVVSPNGIFQHIFGDPSALFGRSAEEFTGRTADRFLDPPQAAAWTSRFTRAMHGETVTLRERRGGDTWYVEIFPLRWPEGCVQTGYGPDVWCAGAIARKITPWATAEQQLRHTVLGALKAQEFERNTVSRFLHDSVGQNLTGLGLQLDLIRMDLEGVSPETCLHVGEVQKLLGEIMESVREYSYELNPATVERAGIRLALDRLDGRLRARFSGTLRVNVDPSLKLEPSLARALYQIAQEAVENAVQHSCCSAIEIAIKSTRTGTVLEVRDNGRGFDPADLSAGRRGLGLLSMEHYAAQAGLELTISSSRDTGTAVRAAIPGDAEK
jgi:signal transduction histidine kinase